MRTNLSLRNIGVSLLSQIVLVVLGFVSRKVFLDSLGIEYLGINGLLTNVLSVMALVESGIGISIVYNLYKPLAEQNEPKIIALVQLYKKAYSGLAAIVLIISAALYPFLGYIMKGSDSIAFLWIIYSLFVAKNIVSYLNAHKWSLINADQRGYVLALANLLFQVITNVSKIVVLVLTKNFILYLAIEFVLYVLQNMYNGRIVNKRYPYIKTKKKYKVDHETKENLKTNVKAMFLHNIGGFLVFGTTNILISIFINVATVGLYSNYTMIIQQLEALLLPVLGGISNSVGNLIATESVEKNYAIFKVSYFVNFWIYSIAVVFLYNVLEPFINWWLGRGLLLANITFILVLVNFYLTGLRNSISTFKNKAGLFAQDRYAPIIEGVINLGSALIFVHYLGLAGIFLGTLLSNLATVFFTQPIIVYKHLFKKPVISYYYRYGLYTALTVLCCYGVHLSGLWLGEGSTFMMIMYKAILSLLLPNALYVALFYRSADFTMIKTIALSKIKGTRRFMKNKQAV
ncbi:polysaccharide biosynthesis protein [Fictibacillus macauensis ZFHKF-1]|uniref:Polysaccharide biosynthesis protein n=1 Tax=Fictibacillus macauensis ZFHKF-1 TaxID=1196324 RepID=I8AL14_9BACL|nr:hypothetical protein [Fictibacillus macauensis]EIT86542.1 polysaccharide biosynthesis protein [Fictibacillus macauensis ZFHKF-1]